MVGLAVTCEVRSPNPLVTPTPPGSFLLASSLSGRPHSCPSRTVCVRTLLVAAPRTCQGQTLAVKRTGRAGTSDTPWATRSGRDGGALPTAMSISLVSPGSGTKSAYLPRPKPAMRGPLLIGFALPGPRYTHPGPGHLRKRPATPFWATPGGAAVAA